MQSPEHPEGGEELEAQFRSGMDPKKQSLGLGRLQQRNRRKRADMMGTDYSQWGILEALGITENLLLSIIANNCEDIPNIEIPTYWVLIELYHFSETVAKEIKRRQNRLLKLLVDTLFPTFSISRADRLERKVRGLCATYSSLPSEQKLLFLQKQWKPQPTGLKSSKDDITKEMKKYGLHEAELELLLKNPMKVAWQLQQPASHRFYADVHTLLIKKRVPMEEIGMIYRQIDQKLEAMPDNRSAYMYVNKITLGQFSSEEDTSDSNHSEDNSEILSADERRYVKHNVQRREKRAQSKIKHLQASCNSLKSVNERQDKQVHQLSAAVKEYKRLVHERNSEIKSLKQSIRCLEETVDFLDCELQELRIEQDESNERSESCILDLTRQLEELQRKYEVQMYSSKSFNSNVRELYYALLAMRIPPGKIRPIIENVMSCLLPSVSFENIRLPKKSCASYMRSQEMPTISSIHKDSQLSECDKWHLNSDGTTLHQAKKVGFLINGIALGVCDVADGSSQTALEALQNELQKLDSIEPGIIKRIVSSTSDGASTQSKFNRLLEQHTQREPGSIVNNKCAMHLGVNLRYAQVKAMSAVCSLDPSSSTSIEEHTSSTCSESTDRVSADSEGSSDSEDEPRAKRQYHDLDTFVHEICKAFGHLGTPEY